jgi:outer membrane biogenesis lipoprotein LolB
VPARGEVKAATMPLRSITFSIFVLALAGCSMAGHQPPAEPASEEQLPTTENLAGCWRAAWDSDYGPQSMTYCFDGKGSGTSYYSGDQEGHDQNIVYRISGNELTIAYQDYNGKIATSSKYDIRLAESSMTLTDVTESRSFRLECRDVVNSEERVSCRK